MMEPPTQRVLELALELQHAFKEELQRLSGGDWDGATVRIAMAVTLTLRERFKTIEEPELLSLVQRFVTATADRISIDAIGIAGHLIEHGFAPETSGVPPTDPAPAP